MPVARGVTIPETVRSVDIAAPIDIVYATVTDFAHYPDFVEEVESVEVYQEPGSELEVCFTLRVVKRFSYRVKMHLTPPHRVDWELIEGDIFTENRGGWLLEPKDGGEGTRATYHIAVSLELFVPRAVRNLLVALTLPATLRQFRDEAERRARALSTHPSSGGTP